MCYNLELKIFRPDLIDFGRARKQTARENLRVAFDIAERVFNITPLLDPEGECMQILNSLLFVFGDC